MRGGPRPTTSRRFVTWCVGFLVTLVMFVSMAQLAPTALPWIALSLVLSALMGAASFPLAERAAAKLTCRDHQIG